MPPSGDYTQYTIVVTVDGSQLPRQLVQSGNEFKLYAQTVISHTKEADSAIKKFGASSDTATEKLSKALSTLQPSITYLSGYAQALQKSEEAGRRFAAAAESDQKVLKAGLDLASAEGKSLLSVLSIKQQFEEKIKSITNARKLEAKEAAIAQQEINRSVQREISDFNALTIAKEKSQLKISAAIESSNQGVSDLRLRLAAVREDTEAENELNATIRARIDSQKLGISTTSEEARILRLNIIEEQRLKVAIEQEIAARRSQAAAISQAAAQGAASALAVAGVGLTNNDLKNQVAAIKAGAAAELEFKASIMARVEAERLGISVESEEGLALKKLYVDQLKLNQEVSQAQAKYANSGVGLGESSKLAKTIATIAAFTFVYKIAAEIKEATELTVKFNTELVRLTTLAGISREQAAQWSSGILNISVETGIAADKLVKGMFVITSSSYRGKEALDLLKNSARASAIGLGDVDVVARAVTAAMTAFANQGLTASQAVDVLIGATIHGNIEVDSLSKSMSRVISLASTLGFTFGDTAAFIATFSRVGADADEAATALRGFMNAAMKESPKSEAALRAVGLSWRELKKEMRDEGLAPAFATLTQKFQHTASDLSLVIGNVRALTGVIGVAVNQGDQFAKITKNINDNLGIFAKEAWDLAQQSPDVIFSQMHAAIQVAEIEIVQGMLPALQNISTEFKNIITNNPESDLKSFGQVVGEKLTETAKIVKFLAENLDTVKIAIETIIATKLIDWLLVATRHVDILTARVAINEGAIISLRGANNELLAVDFAGTLNKWLTGFNLWSAGIIAGLLLLNNAIDIWKSKMDSSVESYTKLNDVGKSINNLRVSENYALPRPLAGIKKSDVDAVRASAEVLKQEISSLENKVSYNYQKLKTATEAYQNDLYHKDIKNLKEDLNIRYEQLAEANKLLEVSKKIRVYDNTTTATKPKPPTFDDEGNTDPKSAYATRIDKRIGKEKEEYELELKMIEARRADALEIFKINEGLLSKGVDEKYVTSLDAIITGTNGVAEAVLKAAAARKVFEAVSASGAKAGSKEAEIIASISAKRQEALTIETGQEKVEQAVLNLRKESLSIVNSISQQSSTNDLKDTHALLTQNQSDLEKVNGAIVAWKIALESLRPGTIAYNEALSTFNKLTETSNELSTAHIKLVQQGDHDAVTKATKSVDLYVAKLNIQKDKILASTDALKGLDRELLIQDTIEKELANHQGINPEELLKLAEKIRAAFIGIFQAEDLKQNILDPLSKIADQIKEKLIGAFVDIASGVDVQWKDMLKSIYQSFVKTTLDIAARQLQLSITNATSNGNGGSIIGTVGTVIQNFFGGKQQPTGAYGPTQDGGNIYQVPATGSFNSGALGAGAAGFGVGATIGGAVGQSAGAGLAGGLIGAGLAIAAVSGWTGVGLIVGAVIAVVGVLVGVFTKIMGNRGDWAKIEIGLKNGKYAETQIRGDAQRAAQLGGVASGIVKGLNDFVASIGGVITTVSNGLLTIGRKGHGKDTKYFVNYANGLVADFGNDFQSAMEFATIQALKQSDFQGLTEETKQAIKNTSAQTLEQLQSDLQFAQKVFDEGLPPLGQTVEHAVQEFQADLIRANNLQMPTSNIFTQLQRSLTDQRNQLLGIQQDPEAKYHQDIKDFNEGIDRMVVQIELQKNAAIQNAAAAKMQMDAAMAQLESARANGIAAHTWGDQQEQGYIDAVKAFYDAQKAYLDAQLAIDQLTQEQLILLGSKIDPGTETEHDPAKRPHKGSGGSTKTSDQDSLREQLKTFFIDQLDEYNRAMAQINQAIASETKLAHGDAKLLEEVNRQRKIEVETLNNQTRAKLDPYIKDSGKDDFQKGVDSFRTMTEELNKLPRSVMPKWMLEMAKGNWLKAEMKTLQDQINLMGGLNYNPTGQIDQIKQQHDQLLKDIQYLGAGAEQTAKLIEEANKAQEAALRDLKNNIVGQLLGYLHNAPGYEKDIVKYQQAQVDIQFALLKAQMIALNIWDQYAKTWEDAYHEATRIAGEVSKTTQEDNRSNINENSTAQNDYINKIKDAARTFYDLIKSIKDEQSSLGLGSYSPLTAEQKYKEAQAQLNALIPLATSGDQTALSKINQAIESFLQFSQGYNASGSGYQLDYQFVQHLLSQLGNLQFTYGNQTIPYDPSGQYNNVVGGHGRIVTLPDGSNVWIPYGQSAPTSGAVGGGSGGYTPGTGPALPPGTIIPGLPSGSPGTGGSVESYAVVQAVQSVGAAVDALRTDFNSFRDEVRRYNVSNNDNSNRATQSLLGAASAMQTLSRTFTAGRGN